MANLLATLLFLFAVAAAATAINVENAKKEQFARCEKQIMKQQQQLFTCQEYLRQSSKTLPTAGNQGGGWRELFPLCCVQLEQLDKQCRCLAISQVVEQLQQKQQGELQGIEMQEMLQTAQSLPNLCRLKPQYCPIQSSTVSF